MKYSGYRKMEIRELQLLQLDVMKEIHEVCIKHKIEYYLIAGSILGAVRHGGFIPWDDDIDIAMMRPQYDKFRRVFFEEFDQTRYFLQDYDTDKEHRPALMRFCIKGTIQDLPYEYHLKNCKNTYIDIFPLDNVPNGEKKRKIHAFLNRICDKLLIKKLYITSNKGWNEKVYWIVCKILPLNLIRNMKVRCMKMYNNDHRCYAVCSMESHYSYEKQTMDKSIYGKPTLIKFEDTYFYGPEKTEEYLMKLYGINYMQIPSEDKREKPFDVYIVNDKENN